MVKSILIFAAASLLVIGVEGATLAKGQEQGIKIIVQVDGLSCPFCSFGLEKKLKKLDGAETVTIKVDEAIAEVIFAPGTVIDREKIVQAVTASGFTPREIKGLR